MVEYCKDVFGQIKKIRVLTGAALMTASTVILDFFRIVLTQTLEISFSFLGVAMAAMLYGPVVGGLVGGVADILEYLIRPSGAFFIGFTINKIITGVIFGLFLYKKKPTLKRLALTLLVENIIVILILTPLWLNIMYGTAFFAIARVIRMVVLFPIKLAVMYTLCKSISNVRLKNGVV
ncbi:MAG: folate family ECF transporter S component [Anaerotignaceae bacterium]